ncbi:helix-hairpin-helix domain-containing protein [Glaciibacter sp. 2TAF33]|uniref:helix-hairpin-helix domain-containing protein n=1 Tax=Glaciibacter sp. 2TAF33 TaxID=3233015 RepID=UPI003F925428
MEAPEDVLARLDPAARLTPAGAPGGRPRLRLGVGAAVVLLILALVTAVIVSAVGQQAGRQVIAPAAAATDAATDAATIGPGFGGADPGAAGNPGASADATNAAGAIIFVHVLGAVRRGGLFELREGARVMDAVAAAGGLSETADPAGVNLARLVADGEQLYVPALGEAQPGAPPGAAPGVPGGGTGGAAGRGAAEIAKVNLNSAAAAELELLPRIGPAMAQRIIDYREANGRFTSVQELRNVTGIGEKTFDGLKDLVTV